ncbi:MAG TPA: thiamine-phosphate kinase [Acidobacteriota bacterium]|nr:thiamine-phosphate kinase [Acidobacteriota bacterium]
MPTEFEIIREFQKAARRLPPEVLQGIGDDCAVLSGRFAGSAWTITKDLLIEGVHFRTEWISPRFLGRKSLLVSLSDLGAMGAVPSVCLLGLALPPRLVDGFRQEFQIGFLGECSSNRIALVGGDLSESDRVTISVTAVGTIEQGEAVGRAGARPGDGVYVWGSLGLARQGLELLRRESPTGLRSISSEEKLKLWAGSPDRFQKLRAHFLPQPNWQVGAWLRIHSIPSAMIDVSDGLAGDLGHLLEAGGVAAHLDPEGIRQCYQGDAETIPLEEILAGGEDYALLFTVPPEREPRLSEFSGEGRIRRIGTVADGEPLILLRFGERLVPCAASGYDHFPKSAS